MIRKTNEDVNLSTFEGREDHILSLWISLILELCERGNLINLQPIKDKFENMNLSWVDKDEAAYLKLGSDGVEFIVGDRSFPIDITPFTVETVIPLDNFAIKGADDFLLAYRNFSYKLPDKIFSHENYFLLELNSEYSVLYTLVYV